MLDYPPGTAALAIRVVNLAPTLVGLFIGLPTLILYFLSGNASILGFAYYAGSWAFYTSPSLAGRHPFAYTVSCSIPFYHKTFIKSREISATR